MCITEPKKLIRKGYILYNSNSAKLWGLYKDQWLQEWEGEMNRLSTEDF